jgi:hypothetical protein
MTKQFHSSMQKASEAYREVRLPDADRARIRAALEKHADAFPVRISPFARLHTQMAPVPSPYYSWIRKPMPLFALLLAAGLFGGGTSYAAEGSLPGDTLYSVKTHVNEPVREALAFTSSSRANVEADIATERLTEAQHLAAAGNLSTSTAATLAADFADHVSRASDSAKKLSEVDPVAAAQILTALEAQISAHKDSIVKESGSDESDAHVNLKDMLSLIAEHLATTPDVNATSTASVATSTTPAASTTPSLKPSIKGGDNEDGGEEEHSFLSGVKSIFSALTGSSKDEGGDHEGLRAPVTTASSTISAPVVHGESQYQDEEKSADVKEKEEVKTDHNR